MPTFKVKTNLSEFLVESETYRQNGQTAVFFDGYVVTNIIKGVVSVEQVPYFKELELVNLCGNNGIISLKNDLLVIDFGKVHLDIESSGKIKGYDLYIQHGQVEPTFKLHDRVVCDGIKGVVTEVKDGYLYPIVVTFDTGVSQTFTGDGKLKTYEEPTLSLVTPNWTGLELEYYNALIKAGASEAAADYAATMTLTGDVGIVPDFRTVLAGNFAWGQTPWGNEYWVAIHAAIQTPPSVKLERILSDKTPEIGDLVIAGDYLERMWCVGIYTAIDNEPTNRPYKVTDVGGDDYLWFKNIRCLNL